MLAPGMTLPDLQALFKPLMQSFDGLRLKYSAPNFELFSGYKPAYEKLMPPIPVGVQLYGGRLIPRTVVETNSKGLWEVFRRIVDDGELGYSTLGVNLNQTVTGYVDNAITPAWRNALYDVVIAA